jgi:enediyne biosynthesis protein E4
VGESRLFRNLGDGKFESFTRQAGVGVNKAVGASCSFADVDNDGDTDLYVTTVRGGNVLFENDGSGRFRDITKKAGLTYNGHSSAAVFFDYDRDGLLDLFLTNVGVYTSNKKVLAVGDDKRPNTYYEGLPDAFSGHLKPERSEASILYRNLGKGKFKNVSNKMRLAERSWSGDASMLDANQDGWLDLYVLNMQGHDHYYENSKGEYFIDRTEALFPKTPWGSTGIKVFDHNNDGLMDIYVTDLRSDLHKNIGPGTEKYKPLKIYSESYTQSNGKSIFGNALFENMGGGFREISDRLGTESYWPWGPSIGDLNADGYEDIFVPSGMNYPWRYAVNKVFLNLRGEEFLDAEFLLGVEPRRKTAAPWFTLDCAGRDQGRKECRLQKDPMTVWGAVGSRSSAVFDIDNDGDLDIVTNDFNSAPMVLVSDLSDKKEIRFLKVNLAGSASNYSGIGATVTVSAGGQTYSRFHDGKSGYLSQSLAPIYFGLGEAAAVDRIEVLWPSGKRQTVDGPISVNTVFQIKEE